MRRFDYIESWTEEDLNILPKQETDQIEFKQNTTDSELANKISIAASAFWNSGGGLLIVGINKSGQIDPINDVVGHQPRRDWVDQVLLDKVAPVGVYHIKPIQGNSAASHIPVGRSVLVIEFEESHVAPHMAYDNRYYIRAGAHSVGASHFFVEAIRARRSLQRPWLRARLQHASQKDGIIELVLTVINEATALDISINFDPIPDIYHSVANSFPLSIPFIDRQHPFTMDFYIWGVPPFASSQSTILHVEYSDILGNRMSYQQEINPETIMSPLKIGSSELSQIAKNTKEIVDSLEYLKKLTEMRYWNEHMQKVEQAKKREENPLNDE